MRRAVGVLLAAALLVWPGMAVAQSQPAASPSSEPPRTGISGYMEAHFTKAELESGQLDFHRFILLFTHRFSDRIRFVSELELENAFVAGLEPSGELELEQAYLDFLLTRGFNVRAGMLLMPVGIINERHEPPVFYGVERPFVDTVIIPTTWFEVGAGIHGEVGRGWRYRLYLTSPLNAVEFTAEDGLRGGRQKGSRTNVGHGAATGRVEYVGRRGLTLGASFWTGRSGFALAQGALPPRFDVPVRVVEADGRWSLDRLELRAQLAQVGISNADQLNDAGFRQTGVNPNIASAMRGGYLEAGYRVLSGHDFGDVGAFVRYENFDTQYRMPAGSLPLREFDRDALVVGGTYWPDPDIAIKVDYVVQRNRSTVINSPNSLNVGLGWWF